jgi:histidinol-phosphatase (PHP family)
LHTHTTFCDGQNTPEEIILTAIEKGFDSIGFSGHGYTPFTLAYCMTAENTEKYIKEVNRLKKEYANKIPVFLGIEYDLFSVGSLQPYDYVIGSVHYDKKDNTDWCSLDIKSPENLIKTVNEKYNGNVMEMVKKYYSLMESLPDKLDRVDIVGHLDLITKSNDLNKTIDTESEEYRYYASKCIKRLASTVGIFEINNGAIARGIKKEPYPDKWLLREIKRQGGAIVINSDCHYKDKLDFYSLQAIDYAKECGFTEIMYFNGRKFLPQSI